MSFALTPTAESTYVGGRYNRVVEVTLPVQANQNAATIWRTKAGSKEAAKEASKPIKSLVDSVSDGNTLDSQCAPAWCRCYVLQQHFVWYVADVTLALFARRALLTPSLLPRGKATSRTSAKHTTALRR